MITHLIVLSFNTVAVYRSTACRSAPFSWHFHLSNSHYCYFHKDKKAKLTTFLGLIHYILAIRVTDYQLAALVLSTLNSPSVMETARSNLINIYRSKLSKKSSVWLPFVSTNGQKVAKQQFAYHNSTTNMADHLITAANKSVLFLSRPCSASPAHTVIYPEII